MKQILYILIILLLLYYLVTKYKDIECFNVGSQLKICNDCEDCNNHGIASGIKYKCSCICKDGYTGTNCEISPSIRPVFPDKIQRLPWKHIDPNPKKNPDGYISIFLDKMNGKINGSNSYTSRLKFTTGPHCQVMVEPILDSHAYIYNPVIYYLAQFGFYKISLFKRDYDPINFYKYRIELIMNLTKDNIPEGIEWLSTYIFEFKFYVRTFYSQKDFQNMNKLDKDKKPMNTSCDMWEDSLTVTKTLNTDPINFEGTVDFNVGNSEPCPPLNNTKSTHDQQVECVSKDFCKFDDGILYNSCDNICSNDSKIDKTVLYLELYRIDIKLIQT